MPNYNYTAVSLEGILTKGKREADSVKRLADLLASEGLELVQADYSDSRTKKLESRQKLKTSELANLLFQVGIQLRAGVTIIDALRTRE